jgi:hypothetical protein
VELASDEIPTSGGWSEVERELERCRRSGRSFSLLEVRLSTVAARPASSLRRRFTRATRAPIISSSADWLRRELRSVDAAWDDRDACYVLLWDTDDRGCKGFTERLSQLVPAPGNRSTVCWVTFPDDGLTSDALREALRSAQPVQIRSNS